jgi:hypothetical protein
VVFFHEELFLIFLPRISRIVFLLSVMRLM